MSFGILAFRPYLHLPSYRKSRVFTLISSYGGMGLIPSRTLCRSSCISLALLAETVPRARHTQASGAAHLSAGRQGRARLSRQRYQAASAVFDRALACAPSVLFIDELDALPDRAKISQRGADWWLPVITSVLLRIDQVRADKSGVVLLGATNHVDRVDAAIRRPGRFDRSFLIPPPDAEGFAGILRLHLGAELPGIDLLPLARQVPGSTGADAVQWIKQARRKALTAGRAITLEDLRAVMMPRDTRSPRELSLIALHEAGHAVVARSLGIEVRSVTIQARGNADGWAELVIDRAPDRDRLDNQIVAILAGRAADIVLGDGPNAGAVSDLEKATEWVAAAHVAFGLRGRLTHRGGAIDAVRLLATDRALATVVEADLHRLQDEAVSLVQRHKREIVTLAEALVERRILDASEIDAAMKEDLRDAGPDA